MTIGSKFKKYHKKLKKSSRKCCPSHQVYNFVNIKIITVMNPYRIICQCIPYHLVSVTSLSQKAFIFIKFAIIFCSLLLSVATGTLRRS
jgi:hypothetical protein